MAETQETRIQQIHRKLTEQGYIPSIYIDYAVEGALEGTPFLIEGAPGVGKTSLAYAVADMMGLELIRVQFYDGLTYDKILYDYDYQKQLLTIQAVQGALKEELSGKTLQEAVETAGKIDFFGTDFLIERPVLKAISGKKRYVLLLDEVEKASEEIEYTLLEVLETFSMSIPQYGTVSCPEEMRPIVFLTSNHYRELSEALKRRCNYLYIQPKTQDEIRTILSMQAGIDARVAEAVSACAAKLQGFPMKQQPSISELASWAKYLSGAAAGGAPIPREAAEATYCMIAKNREDQQLLRQNRIGAMALAWAGET